MKRIITTLVFALTLTSCADICAPTPACDLEHDPGICDSVFIRYFFNTETRECESFIWGGCGGEVPFETLEACMDSCLCR
ncbi:MAG: BPTI/Kunitz domain-containing protein [Cryomorphaceae bacterium]|nr:BPTI/Kunitz domain-containing protein [Cryomorphaceae bacterium]